MAETHSFKNLYFHLHTYPDLREWQMPHRRPHFTESAWTQEIEGDYRSGRGRLFRFWPTRTGIVFGRWRSGRAEEAALMCATVGRPMEITADEINDWGTS